MKNGIESLKLQHNVDLRIFTAILGLAITIFAGIVAGWLFDKISFDASTVLKSIIVGLVFYIALDKSYLRMKNLRKEIEQIEKRG